jgi:Undecaprenyl-phosphate glucose phosphotransferase
MSDGAAYLSEDRNAATPDWTQFASHHTRGVSGSLDDQHPAQPTLRLLVGLGDLAAVIGATVLVAVLQARCVTHHQAVADAVSDIVAVLFLFATSHGPRVPRTRISAIILQQIQSRGASLVLAGSLQSVVLWFLGAEKLLSVEHALLWVAACGASLAASRIASSFVLGHPAVTERMVRKYAIIGSDRHAFLLEERLARSGAGIEVVGIFDDAPARPESRASLDDLIGLTHETKLHGIIIALPPRAVDQGRMLRISQLLRGAMTDVFVMPYLMNGPDMALPVQSIGKVPVMVLQRRPLDEWQTVTKRALDVTLSLLAFILFIPLFTLAAIAIKLESPGPILFRQPRRGFNNRPFMVFKFRSMYVGSADALAWRQTSRGDPRVTRTGKWLRKLSIDELPQLLNVLRGEMSLVGPRPHAPQTSVEGKFLNDAIGDYVLRYRVKPGITGWAQVNGARGELVTMEDLRRRLSYDFEYIQRWSIGLDLKIMALTAIREIVSRHAF